MKRRIKAILRCLSCSLILCTSLVTAGCTQPKSVMPINEEDKMEGELTAYYVDWRGANFEYGALLPLLQADYPDLTIDATAFTSQEEFMQRTMTELNAGGGPDLFLLTFGTQMSFDKMSRNGTYLNLSPYMKADPSYNPDNYFQAAMQAGQVDGQQYILPLAFTHMNLFTSKEKLDEMGVSLSENSTWVEIMDALSAAVDRAEQDSDITPLATLLTRNDFVTMFLSGFGIPIVDMDKGQVVLEKENLKVIADFVRQWFPFSNEAYSQKIFLVADTQKYSQVDYSINNSSFIDTYYHVNQTDHILNQETVSIPFPAYDDPSSTVGQMYMYAAVNGNSDNKQLAYNTLRALMDLPLSVQESDTAIFHSWPIKKQNLENYLTESCKYKTNVLIDGESISFKYDEETNQKILDTADQINQVTIDNVPLYNMIREIMNSYTIDGTKTFDECWDDLVNRLTLYINE